MGSVYKPDYHGGSIVNLMATLEHAMGGKSKYPQLKNLAPEDIRKYKNIILLVIDGLGYDYVKNHARGSFLERHTKGSMTSVFPSTTGACIPTFATGVAPQQHGFTGWFILFREIGSIAKSLPFQPRYNSIGYSMHGIPIGGIFNEKSFSDKIKRPSYIISDASINKSDFAVAAGGSAKHIGTTNMKEFFTAIRKTAQKPGKKFIYGYWLEWDKICHHYGLPHPSGKQHLKRLDKQCALLEKLKDTCVIVTADHGFVHTPTSRMLHIEHYPKLHECLSLPLCGDRRVLYAYVKVAKRTQFEREAQKLHKYFTFQKSADVIRKGWFGLGKANPKLIDRIGDYVIMMKENYVLMDDILGSKRSLHFGNHSGVSHEEMYVPLILVTS